MLPKDHPQVKFLTDKNHCVQAYARYLWLCVEGKGNVKISSSDAFRLKRNFAYFINMYSECDFETFKAAAQAVVNHHFGDHTYCDIIWCVPKQKQEAEKMKADTVALIRTGGNGGVGLSVMASGDSGEAKVPARLAEESKSVLEKRNAQELKRKAIVELMKKRQQKR